MKPLGAEDIDGGVLGRLHAVVTSRPGAIALKDAGGTSTFTELTAAAADVRNAVRSAVRAGGGSPAGAGGAREPVAVLMGHHRGAVAAVFGVVASGHPVLVLDPLTPPVRLRRFVERAGVRVCLCDDGRESAAREVGVRIVAPSDIPAAAAADELWDDVPDPRSPAVVGFTSGSTGNPKQVLVDHRQLTSDAWLNSTAGGCYDAGDVVAHTLPMAFNAGVCLTLAGPLVGCTTALYDVRTSGVDGLAPWVAAEGITVAHASPAIIRRLVQSRPDPAKLAGLRVMTVAGEPVHGRDVEAARAVLPRTCTIHNRYGSSETGLIAEYRVDGDHPRLEGPLPAGRPLGPTGLTLLGSNGCPVPDGEAGTVAVTRRTLAVGYDNPAQTATSFTDNEDGTRTYRTSDVGRFGADGLLHLLGRRDHSVKIRGYLVEPGEVDAALFALPDVREALVVGAPRPDDGLMRLVAYVVPSVENLGAAAIRAALRETLPPHMVPEAVVFLESLPRTDRGKLDRSALPEAPAVRASSTGQQLSEWEQVVADAWGRVLSLEDVGLDDDFFELGGDSLAAETLMASMVEDFGVPPEAASTSALVQAPTVRRLARRLTRRPQADETLVPLREKGSRPPVFLVAGGGGLGVAFVPLSRHLGDDQPVYALQARGMERRGVPDWSVRAIARRNVASVLSVQPAGPYHLAGHSFGGLVALEMAHQLRRAGHEVALLALLDSFPPDPTIHPSRHRSLRHRVRDAFGVATTGIRGTPGLDQYWRFYRLSEVLHRRYRTEPYAGEALVVVADSPERELRAAWDGHLSGPWRLVDVDGDHLSMLRDPFAAETAVVLEATLLEAALLGSSERERSSGLR